MSILTKKVTMTETAWEQLRCLLTWAESSGVGQLIDTSDAITALAEAETVAVTDTYALPSRDDAAVDVDQWREDALAAGCRCGVCDRG